MSRSQGQRCWSSWKGVVPRIIHMKQRNSSAHCLKLSSNVKDFFKHIGVLGKVLSEGILKMKYRNIEALALTFQISGRLNFYAELKNYGAE